MIGASVGTRFSADDTPHRLGAIAANMARIETFARRPYHPEAVRSVMEESRWFVEWAAKNVQVDDAAQLVELQRLITGWLREDVWDNTRPDASRRAEIAGAAASWSQRILEMSGLADSTRAVGGKAEAAIPPDHKFAIIALEDVWHRVDMVHTSLGIFTRIPPVEPADHWKDWLGSLWYDGFRRAEQHGLYLVVTRSSNTPDVQNVEERDIARDCELLRYGLAIATSCFKCRAQGIFVVGAHGRFGRVVNSAARLPALPSFPGSKSIQLTEPDMCRAGLLAEALAEIPSEGRLWRAVACFMRGMEETRASQRVHEFVRCVDGIIMPHIGRSKGDFVSAVSSVVVGASKDVLEHIYDLRSAEEHLHDPLNRVQGATEEDRKRVLFERAAQAEAIARHMLSRVLESSSLRQIHELELTAERYWSNTDRSQWGMPLDLGLVVLR